VIIRLIFLAFAFLGISLNGEGQVNLKIGYNVAVPDFLESDQLLSSYAPENTELVDGFGHLRFLHGIQLGMRYQMGSTALELGWENMNRNRASLFYNATSDSFIERSYKYSLAAYSIGMDNYFGNYGIGSVLKSQSFNIQREIGSNSLQVVNDRNWNLRLHFIWIVQKSRSVSLALQPYYQLSLGAYDLQPLADELNVTNLSTSMRPSMFGISLVFYNGKQER
jgi:hypothetical protein